jgi:Peptidase family S41/N-terminal domain of Peptidase_S41 in eukaryotic IRBP
MRNLRTFLRCVLFLPTMCVPALADAPPSIPDTPVGHVFSAWLDAFNSGDRSRMESFINTYHSKSNIEQELFMRKGSEGFDLLAVQTQDKAHLVIRLKEKASPMEVVGVLDIRIATVPTINRFNFYAAPPGSKFEEVTLDKAARSRIIESALNYLNDIYVFPDTAKKMSADVRAREKRGEYDELVDGDSFANKLTSDLRSVSHDKHLSVEFDPHVRPAKSPDEKTSKADHDARARKDMAAENCGFEKLEHLPGNIGYLKFDMFAPPSICGDTAVAAMGFLANSDAIVFDLRENGGGAPNMVAFLQSYLFDSRTHLNDLYERKENVTEQFWTSPYVSGKKMPDVPVFVLMSKNTFSGGEEFCYNLKVLKRATLIGETTGGGAHPVGPSAIDDHFTIFVPFARAINPVTKTNWEGVGVEPDVKVAADDALNVALKMAREKPTGSQAQP